MKLPRKIDRKRKKGRKSLEDKRKVRILAALNLKFGYPGKFPERASRKRHYPFKIKPHL